MHAGYVIIFWLRLEEDEGTCGRLKEFTTMDGLLKSANDGMFGAEC
jgi:hypothetical protein